MAFPHHSIRRESFIEHSADFPPHTQFRYENEQPQSFGHSSYNDSPLALQSSQDPQFSDDYLHSHDAEYSEFPPGILMPEEYEDEQEITTRPRLTREQVDVLEAQFQTHPKPNSSTKRELALQTTLTLPRVANWFQNRRAKAKQQKKQEEFEFLQANATGSGAWTQQTKQGTTYTHPLQTNLAEMSSTPTQMSASVSSAQSDSSSAAVSASATSTDSAVDSTQEASWQSLQRALDAANAARHRFNEYPLSADEQHAMMSAANPEPPHGKMMIQFEEATQFNQSAFSEWGSSADSSIVWTPSQNSDLDQYDLAGFPLSQMSSHSQHLQMSPQEMYPTIPNGQDNLQSPMNAWPSCLRTPTLPPQPFQGQPTSQFVATPTSQTFQVPFYPASRRGSSSSELANTLGNFGINPAISPPHQRAQVPSPRHDVLFKRPTPNIDIAGRRKRPTPAPIGSDALRSRSYAAPSMSPTTRMTPPTPGHMVRHAKSMGQNLNVRYSGIRKTSSAQRSPLNLSTFAEAQALNNATTEQAMQSAPPMPQNNHLTPPTPVSHGDPRIAPLTIIHDQQYLSSPDQQTPGQFYTPSMNFHMPPSPATPAKPENLWMDHVQDHNQWMAPPLSAPPQFATFPNHTPPYSAGPLTTSSWSEAMTSPEFQSFPQHLHMPQPTYVSPVAQHHHHHHHNHPEMADWPTPYQTERAQAPQTPAKITTEFFIQEFPRQKEEHAHAAQQLSQQKPKNYIFANATPDDYEG